MIQWLQWNGSFFFQAEDGIRVPVVTGVQTCALPICCDDIMPLVSYAVARSSGRGPDQSSTPQLTVPLLKYNGPSAGWKAPGAERQATRCRALLCIAVFLAGAASPAHAQRVTGPWEDGSI